MKKQFIQLVNNKIVMGLCFNLLSFFVFIAVNMIFNYLTYAIVAQQFKEELFIYGKFTACKIQTSVMLPLLGLIIFLLSKLFFILFFTKFFTFIRSYSWPFIGVIVVTDLVYVALQLIPSKINWNFYYHSSFLIRPSISFDCPNWVLFGVSGLFYTFLFQRLTKTSWKDLGIYFLFAITSFFFQLLVTYILFGEIYYYSES